jgi:hypothetical protein
MDCRSQAPGWNDGVSLRSSRTFFLILEEHQLLYIAVNNRPGNYLIPVLPEDPDSVRFSNTKPITLQAFRQGPP